MPPCFVNQQPSLRPRPPPHADLETESTSSQCPQFHTFPSPLPPPSPSFNCYGPWLEPRASNGKLPFFQGTILVVKARTPTSSTPSTPLTIGLGSVFYLGSPLTTPLCLVHVSTTSPSKEPSLAFPLGHPHDMLPNTPLCGQTNTSVVFMVIVCSLPLDLKGQENKNQDLVWFVPLSPQRGAQCQEHSTYSMNSMDRVSSPAGWMSHGDPSVPLYLAQPQASL